MGTSNKTTYVIPAILGGGVVVIVSLWLLSAGERQDAREERVDAREAHSAEFGHLADVCYGVAHAGNPA